jgi:serine/threonine protein kinase
MTELKLQHSLLDGRYEILECLGRGSYAEIYVARDLQAAETDPQAVVIKALNVLLQGVPDADLERTLIENFQNEAIALDRVRHPNIISRLGHGTALDLAGTPFHYLVLEYLAGGELAARVRHQPFTIERALFYLEQVCNGLAHAHDCGVIHRDIKPQNLLLTADAQVVKIADFGVAKLEATEGLITRVGTNVYAAPEHNPLGQTDQLDAASLNAKQRHLTPAADIYSLAKTTYTLLAGESPRRFSRHQITELPASIATETWAKDVLRVLRRATEEKPEDRYQTVHEFWEDLADATLPPTQPLVLKDQETRPRPSSKLTKLVSVLTEAPPRARFDSHEVLRQLQANGNGAKRPRIVVPVNQAQFDLRPSPQPQALPVPIPPPPVIQPPVRFVPSQTPLSSRRSFRALVAILIIVAFAGILLATHYYVTRRRAQQQQSAAPTGNTNSPYVGREVTVIGPANLRPNPSMNNAPMRSVENGAKVRILSVNDNNTWFEVEIETTADNQPDTNPITRGWMGRKVLQVD